nr:hypothetical protein [Tanacetum cinerariifolium]
MKDELSVIATKLDTPLMLDTYTASMCMKTWCRPSFVRAIIDFRADIELNDTLVVEVPKLEGNNKDVNLDMRIVTMIGKSRTSSLYECCKETFGDSAYDDDKCEDLIPHQKTFCDVFDIRLPSNSRLYLIFSQMFSND